MSSFAHYSPASSSSSTITLPSSNHNDASDKLFSASRFDLNNNNNNTDIEDIAQTDLFCNMAVKELFVYFAHIGQPITDLQKVQACEFPLVCPCSYDNNNNNNNKKQENPTKPSSSSSSSSSLLQIHPRVFDPTFSVSTLPFVEFTPSVARGWTLLSPILKIGSGTYGNVYTLPFNKHGKYVVKMQLMEPYMQREFRNSWTAPILEYEEEDQCYVSVFNCVVEALALFALNTYEETEQSFAAHQHHCIPKVYYTSVLLYENRLYSFMILEAIQNPISLYNRLEHTFELHQIVELIKSLLPVFESLDTCVLQFQNLDPNGNNILYEGETGHMYMIDFGACMFTLPLSYICSLTNKIQVCNANGIPIKVGHIVRYHYENQILSNYYNYGALIAALLYQYEAKPNPRMSAIIQRLRINYDQFQLPSMETFSTIEYMSQQFECPLLIYQPIVFEACANENPSGCLNNVGLSESLLAQHTFSLAFIDNESNNTGNSESNSDSDSTNSSSSTNSSGSRTSYDVSVGTILLDKNHLSNPINLVQQLSHLIRTIRSGNADDELYTILYNLFLFLNQVGKERTAFLSVNNGFLKSKQSDYEKIKNTAQSLYEQFVDAVDAETNNEDDDDEEEATTIPAVAAYPINIAQKNKAKILELYTLLQDTTFRDDLFAIHYWYVRHKHRKQLLANQQSDEITSCVIL